MKGSRHLCNMASVMPTAGPSDGGAPGDKGYGKENKMAASRPDKKSGHASSSNSLSKTKKICKECLYDILYHITRLQTTRIRPIDTKYTKTLRRTVGEMSERHQIFFDSAMRKLEIQPTTARTTIDNVANEMFVDGNFNWGRLVALYSFCAKVAKHCVDKRDINDDQWKKLIEEIADYTAEYVADSLASRIEEHGGWDSFVDYFPEPVNFDKTVLKGLLCTVVGLGALATMVAVR